MLTSISAPQLPFTAHKELEIPLRFRKLVLHTSFLHDSSQKTLNYSLLDDYESFIYIARMSLSISLQLQWSVDQIAEGLMSNIAGLIQAATSDNIQPAALFACVQTGTGLPLISTGTRIRIENGARRQPIGRWR